jgi:phage shock protein C
MNRHLYRCRHDRRIAGVAAGVAEYFGLDVTLVRILWFLSIFFGGATLVVYVGLALIVPLEPLTAAEAANPATVHDHELAATDHRHVERRPGMLTTWLGVGLVLLGGLALIDVVVPGISWRYLWPVFIVGLGGLLIVGSLRREGAAPMVPATAVGPANQPGAAAPIAPVPAVEAPSAVETASTAPTEDSTVE